MTNPIAVVSPAADLAHLAAAINTEHTAVASALRSGVEHARAAGKLLLEAKRKCGHGNWLPWLEKHCPGIGARQAQKYMRLARAAEADPSNANPDSHLTIDEALTALADSQEEETGTIECVRLALVHLRAALDGISGSGHPDELFHLNEIRNLAGEAQLIAAEYKLRCERELGKLLGEAERAT